MGENTEQPSDFLVSRLRELCGLALAALAAFIFIALLTMHPQDPSLSNAVPYTKIHNGAGVAGAYIADVLMMYLGITAYVLPLLFLALGVGLMFHVALPALTSILITLPVMLLALDSLHALTGAPQTVRPGLTGQLMAALMAIILGKVGSVLVCGVLLFASVLWLFQLSVGDVAQFCLRLWKVLRVFAMLLVRLVKRARFKNALQIDLPLPQPKRPIRKLEAKVIKQPSPPAQLASSRLEKERQSDLPLELQGVYNLPPLHFLNEPPAKQKEEDEKNLQQNARQLETQLANYGVKGEVTEICPGPVITIYELEPVPGTKTSTVVGLSDDLARSMSAMSVRVAPMPGRTVIGVELPNRHRKTVTLKQLLATEAFETHPGKLTVSLGVDTVGVPVYADIAAMPHALIAGTTGSGKSVAMNAFILSLLYRMGPDQLRFIMVDPKMLELSIYNDIPHLLTPVITDPNKASSALKWAVREMERRYKLMSELSVKNLQSFNAKFSELKAQGKTPTRLVQTGFDPTTGKPRMEEQELCDSTLPYIVVVIDELADLMMVAGKQVEISIARLAQMARAAGIHLLVATQRPSVDVVTGLIKANIPTRMSFHVTSRIDSRTILDSMGAEQLLGKGDMLYMGNGSTNLQRIHGAFVSEEECNQVADFVRSQGSPQYVEDVFREASSTTEGAGGGATGGDPDDPLYQQAIELVAKEQKASTSFIQRHLKIGYNRAATIIEQLEVDGLVGPADHVGKREVIVRQPPDEGY